MNEKAFSPLERYRGLLQRMSTSINLELKRTEEEQEFLPGLREGFMEYALDHMKFLAFLLEEEYRKDNRLCRTCGTQLPPQPSNKKYCNKRCSSAYHQRLHKLKAKYKRMQEKIYEQKQVISTLPE